MILVCLVGDDGGDRTMVRISEASNLEDTFENWRRRGHCMVPVAAFEVDPEAFVRYAGLLRLPTIVDLDWAVAKLGRAPLAPEARVAVISHVARTPGAASLLAEWAAAASGRKEVAALA